MRHSIFAALAAAPLLLAACRAQPGDPAPADAREGDATESEVGAGPDASAGANRDTAGEPDAGPVTLEGAAFTDEARAAFRVAACAGDDAWIPPGIDRALVDHHCALLRPAYDEYRREWLAVAGPFLGKLRPTGLPTTVVYPFGGGDLVTALATFPDATEITTISLEIAGDLRGVGRASERRLERELATLRDHLGKLFLKAHSRTVNLDVETHGAVPGEVAFSMAALAIHGFEPVTLRYFRFEPDGSIHWLSRAELEAAKRTGRQGPFANAELRFRRPGEARVRVLRHVAHDLSDKSLRGHPPLVRHLDAKGKVAAMTKAASYLLWDDEFSVIRDWLMAHTDWMISDTTGVPPRVARKHGFEQDTYGLFEWPEPFGNPRNADATAFRDLFRGNAPIPFRYGYPDNRSHGHIVVTRRKVSARD